jgi:Cu/Ag efflux protein CusF
MRKIALVVIAVVMALVLGTPAIAQEAMKVTGTVTKIDTEAMSVTIQPQEGAAVTVIMGNAESLSKVKVGEKAEARYAVKDGKNLGKRIRKISDEGCS